jgi:hypothetical protein
MIGSYLNDTITLRVAGAKDKWGEPTTATDVTVKVRFEFGNFIVRNEKGEQVVASGRIYMKNRTISYQDKIIYNGLTYRIGQIEYPKDFSIRYIYLYVL